MTASLHSDAQLAGVVMVANEIIQMRALMHARTHTGAVLLYVSTRFAT